MTTAALLSAAQMTWSCFRAVQAYVWWMDVGRILFMARSMKSKVALCAILVLSWTGSWTAQATDYSDPADILQENREHNQATRGTNIEVDGIIESAKPGNPGWYSIYLEADNGKHLTLIVYPKTKFWEKSKPLDAPSAYKRFVHGQKLRIMHNTFLDNYLKHEMITDMMFVDK
jgi:hypothetical protein